MRRIAPGHAHEQRRRQQPRITLQRLTPAIDRSERFVPGQGAFPYQQHGKPHHHRVWPFPAGNQPQQGAGSLALGFLGIRVGRRVIAGDDVGQLFNARMHVGMHVHGHGNGHFIPHLRPDILQQAVFPGTYILHGHPPVQRQVDTVQLHLLPGEHRQDLPLKGEEGLLLHRT